MKSKSRKSSLLSTLDFLVSHSRQFLYLFHEGVRFVEVVSVTVIVSVGDGVTLVGFSSCRSEFRSVTIPLLPFQVLRFWV